MITGKIPKDVVRIMNVVRETMGAGVLSKKRWGASFFLMSFLFAFQDIFAGDKGGHGEVNLLEPDKTMIFWTWVTFVLLLIILYKCAWKPILEALDNREKGIRNSVDTAVRIREEMAQIEGSREKLIKEADDKAKEIVSTARKAAIEASKVIESKAKEKATILIENATSDIQAAKEKAEAQLRKESADLAIKLAGSLIDVNLDNDKNQVLCQKLISEI